MNPNPLPGAGNTTSPVPPLPGAVPPTTTPPPLPGGGPKPTPPADWPVADPRDPIAFMLAVIELFKHDPKLASDLVNAGNAILAIKRKTG
jgi:hypothetical protein